MSTDLQKVCDIDPMSPFNEPIRVGFTGNLIEVWHNGRSIAKFRVNGDVLMAKISHRGEFLAILTRDKLMMYEVRINFLSWAKPNKIPATVNLEESGHKLQFSSDDTKIMISSNYQENSSNYHDDLVVVEIRSVVGGKRIIKASTRPQDKRANRFSFDLNSDLLVPGVNIGGEIEDDDPDGSEDENRILIEDFHIVSLENMTCNDELEEGNSVSRQFESPYDEHGSVVRLIARHCGGNDILVLCVRTNGATIYEYNTESKQPVAVGTLYIEPAEGVIVNGGISTDQSLIAMLRRSPEGDSEFAFYDVESMKSRFRPTGTSDEDRDKIDWENSAEHVEFPDNGNIVANALIDPEIVVNSKRQNAIVYCANSISCVFKDGRVMQKRLDGFCATFSLPDNWLSEMVKEKAALALGMGLHARLAQNSSMRYLDEELLRMIYESCVNLPEN
jgi:hypothetical protein